LPPVNITLYFQQAAAHQVLDIIRRQVVEQSRSYLWLQGWINQDRKRKLYQWFWLIMYI